jgi:endonuclease G, mitochondrial
MIHPYWDMVLLRVESLSEERRHLTFSVQHPHDLEGRDVVVIGYPALDPRNDLKLQTRIFRGQYNIKRLQPGKLKEERLVGSFAREVEAVTHDSSTLGGNSGSAVIDVRTGHVVGLHFAGIYLDANFAVPSVELAADPRVVDAGVSFADDVVPSELYRGIWHDLEHAETRRDDGTDGEIAGSGTVPEGDHVRAPGRPQPMQWTIPFQLTVRLEAPKRTSAMISDTPLQPAVRGDLTPLPAAGEGVLGGGQVAVSPETYRSFSKRELWHQEFRWENALSAALASDLAYQSPAEIRRIVLGEWGFESCEYANT